MVSPSDDEYRELRERMVRDQIEDRGVRQPELLAALRTVGRHAFVPPSLAAQAHEDGALGIGSGQTISQPYMVARMTEVLELPAWRAAHPGEPLRVMDIGTGSGYQAAVLAAMGAEVIGIERHAELAEEAQTRLSGLGFERVRVMVGDGSAGWPDGAPYAGIVVAAAAPEVPPPLLDQLADGGRLVVPVGTRDHQELTVVRRQGTTFQRLTLEPCVFVPLLGEYGFERA